jgi:hypothetical protein
MLSMYIIWCLLTVIFGEIKIETPLCSLCIVRISHRSRISVTVMHIIVSSLIWYFVHEFATNTNIWITTLFLFMFLKLHHCFSSFCYCSCPSFLLWNYFLAVRKTKAVLLIRILIYLHTLLLIINILAHNAVVWATWFIGIFKSKMDSLLYPRHTVTDLGRLIWNQEVRFKGCSNESGPLNHVLSLCAFCRESGPLNHVLSLCAFSW